MSAPVPRPTGSGTRWGIGGKERGPFRHPGDVTQRSILRFLHTLAQESFNGKEPHKPRISIEQWRPPEPRYVEKARLARRASRYARYQQAVEWGQRGMTPGEVAGHLGLSPRTIQKWLAAGTFPEARKRQKKPSSFDAFAPFVLKRWNEGEHKGITL